MNDLCYYLSNEFINLE